MSLVVAVDPGSATGIAWTYDYRTVSSDLCSPMEAVDRVATFARKSGWVAIVAENFIPRPGVRTWQPDALHVIGGLRYVAYRHGHLFVLQTPADAKRFATDDKLKTMGWWVLRDVGGHENDARRHLLLYLVRENRLDPEVLTK